MKKNSPPCKKFLVSVVIFYILSKFEALPCSTSVFSLHYNDSSKTWLKLELSFLNLHNNNDSKNKSRFVLNQTYLTYTNTIHPLSVMLFNFCMDGNVSIVFLCVVDRFIYSVVLGLLRYFSFKQSKADWQLLSVKRFEEQTKDCILERIDSYISIYFRWCGNITTSIFFEQMTATLITNCELLLTQEYNMLY
jgi:hypothetical protein